MGWSYQPNGRREYRDDNRGGLKFFFDERSDLLVYENGTTVPPPRPEPSSPPAIARYTYAPNPAYRPQVPTSSSAPISIPTRSAAANVAAPSAFPQQSPSYTYQVPIPASLGKRPVLEPAIVYYSAGTEGLTVQPEPELFFVVGRVFARAAPERADNSADGATQYSSKTRVYRDGQATTRNRLRFIVVAAGWNSCSAVPLTTYNGQGVGKPRVVKSDHAIAHTSDRPPETLPEEQPLPGELPMFTQMIRVHSEDRTEKLQSTCRINYKAAELIGHNTPVKSFGVVDPGCIRDLLEQYQIVSGVGRRDVSDSETVRPTFSWGQGSGTCREPGPQYSIRQPGPSRAPPEVLRLAGTNTLIRRGPVEDITDPSLLSRGMHASSLLTGDNEQLFPDYRVMKHPTEFFTVGRVFSAIFDESTAGTSDISQWETSQQKDINGRPVTIKKRKYVVVRAKEGHSFCSALPILTYGGYGVSVGGVRKSEHGVIYTGKHTKTAKEERPGRNESPMRRKALLVIPDNKYGQLDPAARVNYGHIATISHAVRVKPFGVVHRKDRHALKLQWDSVWDDKRKRGEAAPTQGPSGRRPDDHEASSSDESGSDDGDENDSVARSDEESNACYPRR